MSDTPRDRLDELEARVSPKLLVCVLKGEVLTAWEELAALRQRAEAAERERDAAVAWNHRVSVCANHTSDIVDGECIVCERDALREDAERYRWLRECARATSEHWGGRWSLVVEGPAPGGNAPPASIDAAIDAARKK